MNAEQLWDAAYSESNSHKPENIEDIIEYAFGGCGLNISRKVAKKIYEANKAMEEELNDETRHPARSPAPIRHIHRLARIELGVSEQERVCKEQKKMEDEYVEEQNGNS